MRIDFEIAPYDGMLEGAILNRYYIIYQIGDTMQATVNGETLISGDLYECLDACNNHAERTNG